MSKNQNKKGGYVSTSRKIYKKHTKMTKSVNSKSRKNKSRKNSTRSSRKMSSLF